MKFGICLRETLDWEGEWSNDPHDPGGATMKGVIQRVYDGYRDAKGLPRQSVRKITDEELTEIYRDNYWRQVRGDELPAGVDLAVFDFGVNSGPARAARYLQAALGVTQDGHIGAATLAAAAAADPGDLVAQVMVGRRKFIRQIKTYWRFGKGWERRCNGIEAAALAMAGRAVKPDSVPGPASDPDAQSASQPRATQQPTPVTNVAVGTGVAGTIAAGSRYVLDSMGPVPPPPSAVNDSLVSLGAWQAVGQTVVRFIEFAVANPFPVLAALGVVAIVWGAPAVLTYLWSRK